MLKTMTAVLLLALPVSAATIAITSDLPTYQAGDIITLTITGDAEGAESYGIFGQLAYSGVLTDTLGAIQTPLSSGGQEWITGPLAYGDGSAFVWNQIAGLEPRTSDVPAVSTVTLRAVYGGTLTVAWADDLDFFGTTSAPGITISIAGDAPPPPPPPPVEEPPPVVVEPPPEVIPPPYVPPTDPAGSIASAPEPGGGLIFALGLVVTAVGRNAMRRSRREGSPPRSS